MDFEERPTVSKSLLVVDTNWAKDVNVSKPKLNVQIVKCDNFRHVVVEPKAHAGKSCFLLGGDDVDNNCKDRQHSPNLTEGVYVANEIEGSKEETVVNDSRQHRENLGNTVVLCKVMGVGEDCDAGGTTVGDSRLECLQQQGNIALINVETMDPLILLLHSHIGYASPIKQNASER